MAEPPSINPEDSADGKRVALAGSWTISQPGLEARANEIIEYAKGSRSLAINLSGVAAMDTAGAWLIDRCRAKIEKAGGKALIEGAKSGQSILLEEAHYRDFETPAPARGSSIVDLLADIGQTMAATFHDIAGGIAFLGEVVAALGRLVVNPRRFRLTSLVYHIESFGFRSIPIIALINFLVGCIVAQQGVFQLKQFGAPAFAVDLIGILVLRELAVLLTSIMVAGRSGSAITAEIGSMKMREEIDALRVMGLNPIEVLIIPRLLALLISLPLLTFLADMAAIFGGLLTTWAYGGISPEIFMSRLKDAVALNTFLSGLIKAPFMALVIAIVSALEGMAVEGSAESLGRQVTQSVVKSIFMVILVDGLFAMFFAAINY